MAAMDPVFQKLNLKDQKEVFVLNAPDSFQAALDSLRGALAVHTRIGKGRKVAFALAFLTAKKDVDAFAERAAAAAAGDAVVWVAYPKGTSKRYTCDFNRDNGWDRFGAHGFEPVRMVAIDGDWSALRFRRVEFIKTMTRGFAITAQGKAKSARGR